MTRRRFELNSFPIAISCVLFSFSLLIDNGSSRWLVLNAVQRIEFDCVWYVHHVNVDDDCKQSIELHETPLNSMATRPGMMASGDTRIESSARGSNWQASLLSARIIDMDTWHCFGHTKGSRNTAQRNCHKISLWSTVLSHLRGSFWGNCRFWGIYFAESFHGLALKIITKNKIPHFGKRGREELHQEGRSEKMFAIFVAWGEGWILLPIFST